MQTQIGRSATPFVERKQKAARERIVRCAAEPFAERAEALVVGTRAAFEPALSLGVEGS